MDQWAFVKTDGTVIPLNYSTAVPGTVQNTFALALPSLVLEPYVVERGFSDGGIKTRTSRKATNQLIMSWTHAQDDETLYKTFIRAIYACCVDVKYLRNVTTARQTEVAVVSFEPVALDGTLMNVSEDSITLTQISAFWEDVTATEIDLSSFATDNLINYTVVNAGDLPTPFDITINASSLCSYVVLASEALKKALWVESADYGSVNFTRMNILGTEQKIVIEYESDGYVIPVDRTYNINTTSGFWLFPVGTTLIQLAWGSVPSEVTLSFKRRYTIW